MLGAKCEIRGERVPLAGLGVVDVVRTRQDREPDRVADNRGVGGLGVRTDIAPPAQHRAGARQELLEAGGAGIRVDLIGWLGVEHVLNLENFRPDVAMGLRRPNQADKSDRRSGGNRTGAGRAAQYISPVHLSSHELVEYFDFHYMSSLKGPYFICFPTLCSDWIPVAAHHQTCAAMRCWTRPPR